MKHFLKKTSVVASRRRTVKPLDSHHSEVGRHAHPLHVGATPVAACSSHPRNLPGSRLLGLLMEKPSRVHCFPEPETDFGLRLERLECAVRVIQEWRERLDSPPDATCPIPQPEPVVVRTAANPERRASSFLWQGNNGDLKLERSIWDASLLAGVKG